MEADNEIKGDGNSYTTEFRQYDPRLGRWLSLDPLMDALPGMSPFAAYNNNPIYWRDPQGLAACRTCKNVENPTEGQSHTEVTGAGKYVTHKTTFVYHAGTAKNEYKDAGWLPEEDYNNLLNNVMENWFDETKSLEDLGFDANAEFSDEFYARLLPMLFERWAHNPAEENSKGELVESPFFSGHGIENNSPDVDFTVWGIGALARLGYV